MKKLEHRLDIRKIRSNSELEKTQDGAARLRHHSQELVVEPVHVVPAPVTREPDGVSELREDLRVALQR